MGGSNEPSNLVKVNIAMHAFLHKRLFDEHGSHFDLIAYRMLSGQITCAEANKAAGRFANLGKKNSDEVREKKRQMRLGKKHSEETKKKIGAKHKGKTVTDAWQKSCSEMNKGRGAKDWIVTDTTGTEHTITNLKEFCITNSLRLSAMINVARGVNFQHKGWKCRYILNKKNN